MVSHGHFNFLGFFHIDGWLFSRSGRITKMNIICKYILKKLLNEKFIKY